MRYVSDKDFEKLPINWEETIGEIEKAISCLKENSYSQPLKPYLKFGDIKNRIIAMPAYVGGEICSAGVKWIASFPDNIKLGLQRASSITVLNEILTGIPQAIFNTPMVSIIRTASVSGYILKKYKEFNQSKLYNVGIIGYGPIGRYHEKMVRSILADHIGEIYFYDNRDLISSDTDIRICNSWSEVYNKSDIFITCTSSLDRYIDLPLSENKLILDVSLRDFKSPALESFSKPFIVDNWYEVNRENTDIEYYCKQGKISINDCITLCDVYERDLKYYFDEHSKIFFAPMGMGVFDIAIANYYYKMATNNNVGTLLD